MHACVYVHAHIHICICTQTHTIHLSIHIPQTLSIHITYHKQNCDTLYSEEHAVAFAMATHQRLGSLSAFASLQPELVQRIVSRNLRRTDGAAAIRALLLHPRLEARWSVAGYICESRYTHTHTHTHTQRHPTVCRARQRILSTAALPPALPRTHIDKPTDRQTRACKHLTSRYRQRIQCTVFCPFVDPPLSVAA